MEFQLQIDDNLLQEALELGKHNNQQTLIEEALKEYIERRKKEETLQDFSQAWHEAMTGQTIPISQLWAEMENV
ncbi:type II toxin-antitoxin system VapB family antitoxin [Crocosphaera sp. XPORK-15E]|uniref:type II toxin-antitoxin system VapB family antitoxin n=1 Tax=Crocosphaera sp. XPORK-15E TaxID=3110247 RepID=UPI002B214932|nr:type II toxin-antitoxin system VapB family antitoxin [Crocosphaera sp. XPORK-15E]MEA5535057.1 type II toxin-antitoxin system VapB family antitoxin [Crocosphaera sp. XPORK-15E]